MSKRDFFISYNKADKRRAKWIAAVLEQAGYSCYIQAWDFRPGGNFVLDMQKALADSERFIAVLSSDYLTSSYCQAEWAAAVTKDPNNEKRSIIPVRIVDIEPKELLAAVNYVDLFNADEETAEQKLLNAVDVNDIPRDRPDFSDVKRERSSRNRPDFPGSLPFNNLPFARNNYFTGRTQVFEDICTSFENGHALSLTQTIFGMGGLGKTQTALEYAYRYAQNYDYIWWVPAETEETVLIAYKQFAVKMKLLDDGQQDRGMIIETVLNWMDSNRKWLFIYDNVERVSGDTAWWPRNNREHILITTRNKQSDVGRAIDISVFTEKESADFLKQRTGTEGQLQDAKVLAGRLGYLPLALEQAAAYIVANGESYAGYLSLIDAHGLEVLEEVDGVINYALPITATLAISIAQIDQEESRQLLCLCSYMASENIDEGLFCKDVEVLPPPLKDAMQNGLARKRAWRQLTQYSLLKKQDDGKGYSMHRLLQEVVRSGMAREQKWPALCCLCLFGKIYKFTFGDVDSHNQFARLTPHVEAFLDSVKTDLTADEEQEKIAHLYATGGFAFSDLGDYPKALVWNQKALTICEKVLGKEHPYIVAIYNNIASVYSRQDDYPKALEWYQKVLKISENVFELDHPHTAIIYNNIAIVYENLDDYPKVLEWHQKALKIKEKVLGLDHPSTAVTYNNIANVYANQNDYPKALEWHQKALEIKEKVLGLDHPDTATTYNNIAGVYNRQGDYPKALEWYQKALEIREKVLGLEHPDTAVTYNNIAGMYYEQGDYPKALEWFQKALIICEKKLGLEHPHTIVTNENIAIVRASLN